MAVLRTNSVKKTAAAEQEKKKRRRALLAFFLILLFIAAVGFAFFGAKRLLFTDNPRFKLRKLRVDGAGYWKEHQEEFAAKIGLTMGTNLFALDTGELRKKVKNIPNVDSCSVMRSLPDTLIFQITERVPRAFLNDSRSQWVVDGKGIVMNRKQSMADRNLPIIANVDVRGVKDGQKLESIRPAVDLIMMTVHSFPDFKIRWVSLKNPDKMKILLHYHKYQIQVLLPVLFLLSRNPE